jgi:hypothetical protein
MKENPRSGNRGSESLSRATLASPSYDGEPTKSGKRPDLLPTPTVAVSPSWATCWHPDTGYAHHSKGVCRRIVAESPNIRELQKALAGIRGDQHG